MAKILIISPTPSHPHSAGNRARILSLLSALKAVGHQIHFLFVKMESGDDSAMAGAWDGYYPVPYQRPFDRWQKHTFDSLAIRLGLRKVLPYGVDDWFTPELSPHLIEVAKRVRPDVVLVEYVFLSKAFQFFGAEVLKLLDTHDIFGNRHQLCLSNGLPPQWFYTTMTQELRALKRADIVLAIQREEAAYFSHGTSRKVITVGHLAMVNPSVDGKGFSPGRLLVVGSGNQINISAIEWFLAEVFPLLQREEPGVVLEVVGKCAENIKPSAGLILTGQVEELPPCYQRANVVINPVRFGTGLKIKTIEALAYGKPLVTTSAGAAGLKVDEGIPCVIADAPEDFCRGILNFLKSDELSIKTGCAARKYAEDYNKCAVLPLLHEIDRWMTGRNLEKQ